LENSNRISCRMDFTNLNESIYPVLVSAIPKINYYCSSLGWGATRYPMARLQVRRCTVYKCTMRISNKFSRGCLHTGVKHNLDMRVYRNCVESSLAPKVKVMVIRSFKYKSYTVRVEKMPFLPHWTKYMYVRVVWEYNLGALLLFRSKWLCTV